MKFKSIILLGSLCLAMVACEADGVNFLSSPHYASTVISFLPGEGSGYGKSYLPAIVLGAPVGGSKMAGSVDVLSLGVGGEIELAFDGVEIVDGPGPDFIVFENPFWPGSNSTQVWAELGEVAVYTNDGEWHTYECDVDDIGSSWPGCAGWTPTLSYDPDMMDILDPIKTGGDVFDLADLGVERAARIRIKDMSSDGYPPTAGFDLDAVGLIHWVYSDHDVDEFH